MEGVWLQGRVWAELPKVDFSVWRALLSHIGDIEMARMAFCVGSSHSLSAPPYEDVLPSDYSRYTCCNLVSLL